MKKKIGQEKHYYTRRIGDKEYHRALKTEIGFVVSEIQLPDGTWQEVGPEGISATQHPGVDEFLRMLAAQARASRGRTNTEG